MISLVMDRAEPCCTWTLLTTSHCRVRCMYIVTSWSVWLMICRICNAHRIFLCAFLSIGRQFGCCHKPRVMSCSPVNHSVTCNFGFSKEALISTLTMLSSTAGWWMQRCRSRQWDGEDESSDVKLNAKLCDHSLEISSRLLISSPSLPSLFPFHVFKNIYYFYILLQCFSQFWSCLFMSLHDKLWKLCIQDNPIRINMIKSKRDQNNKRALSDLDSILFWFEDTSIRSIRAFQSRLPGSGPGADPVAAGL